MKSISNRFAVGQKKKNKNKKNKKKKNKKNRFIKNLRLKCRIGITQNYTNKRDQLGAQISYKSLF